MMSRRKNAWVLALASACSAMGLGAVSVQIDHVSPADARTNPPYTKVPAPSANDAATSATFTIIDNQSTTTGGGGVNVLHDGQMPRNEDAPAQCHFFLEGTLEGRLKIDLGRAISIAQINTYSWHKSNRAPQIYRVFGSNGAGSDFNPAPKNGTNPSKCGWTLIATVDTRSTHGKDFGGRDAVSISDNSGSVGTYRYLLFEMFVTETHDTWGHTFYGEIDVVEKKP